MSDPRNTLPDAIDPYFSIKNNASYPEYFKNSTDFEKSPAAIFSRHLSIGFKDKFTQLEDTVPGFEVKMWFDKFSFSPFSSNYGANSDDTVRYL